MGQLCEGATSEIEMPTTLKVHYGRELSCKLLDIDQTQEIWNMWHCKDLETCQSSIKATEGRFVDNTMGPTRKQG